MRDVVKIFTGIFLLIMIYLFLFRGRETVAIINTLFDGLIGGIEVLQGRG